MNNSTNSPKIFSFPMLCADEFDKADGMESASVQNDDISSYAAVMRSMQNKSYSGIDFNAEMPIMSPERLSTSVRNIKKRGVSSSTEVTTKKMWRKSLASSVGILYGTLNRSFVLDGDINSQATAGVTYNTLCAYGGNTKKISHEQHPLVKTNSKSNNTQNRFCKNSFIAGTLAAGAALTVAGMTAVHLRQRYPLGKQSNNTTTGNNSSSKLMFNHQNNSTYGENFSTHNKEHSIDFHSRNSIYNSTGSNNINNKFNRGVMPRNNKKTINRSLTGRDSTKPQNTMRNARTQLSMPRHNTKTTTTNKSLTGSNSTKLQNTMRNSRTQLSMPWHNTKTTTINKSLTGSNSAKLQNTMRNPRTQLSMPWHNTNTTLQNTIFNTSISNKHTIKTSDSLLTKTHNDTTTVEAIISDKNNITKLLANVMLYSIYMDNNTSNIVRERRYALPKTRTTTNKPLDDVKVVNLFGDACRETSENSWGSALEKIGDTLQRPITEMVRESQFVDAWRRGDGCPTTGEIEEAEKITQVADYIVSAIINSIPYSKVFTILQHVVGPALSSMGRELQGKNISNENFLQTAMSTADIARFHVQNTNPEFFSEDSFGEKMYLGSHPTIKDPKFHYDNNKKSLEVDIVSGKNGELIKRTPIKIDDKGRAYAQALRKGKLVDSGVYFDYINGQWHSFNKRDSQADVALMRRYAILPSEELKPGAPVREVSREKDINHGFINMFGHKVYAKVDFKNKKGLIYSSDQDLVGKSIPIRFVESKKTPQWILIKGKEIELPVDVKNKIENKGISDFLIEDQDVLPAKKMGFMLVSPMINTI